LNEALYNFGFRNGPWAASKLPQRKLYIIMAEAYFVLLTCTSDVYITA